MRTAKHLSFSFAHKQVLTLLSRNTLEPRGIEERRPVNGEQEHKGNLHVLLCSTFLMLTASFVKDSLNKVVLPAQFPVQASKHASTSECMPEHNDACMDDPFQTLKVHAVSCHHAHPPMHNMKFRNRQKCLVACCSCSVEC